MTTPTTLAETIARVVESRMTGGTLANVPNELFDPLLACARRCEAIDGASSVERTGPAGVVELARLLDAASECDVLAKRVQELEAQVRSARAVLIARVFAADAEGAREIELPSLVSHAASKLDTLRAESTRLRTELAREAELQKVTYNG